MFMSSLDTWLRPVCQASVLQRYALFLRARQLPIWDSCLLSFTLFLSLFVSFLIFVLGAELSTELNSQPFLYLLIVSFKLGYLCLYFYISLIGI